MFKLTSLQHRVTPAVRLAEELWRRGDKVFFLTQTSGSFHNHCFCVCRRMDTQLRYPTLLRHTIDAYDSKGFANITATYCVPLAPGRSRVFVRQPFRFKAKIPELVMSESLLRSW